MITRTIEQKLVRKVEICVGGGFLFGRLKIELYIDYEEENERLRDMVDPEWALQRHVLFAIPKEWNAHITVGKPEWVSQDIRSVNLEEFERSASEWDLSITHPE